MQPLKNPIDVLEIAVRIEKHGEALYQLMAKLSIDNEIKEMFQFLYEEECRHRDTFSALLQNTADYEVKETYPGEYERFLDGTAYRVIEKFKKRESLQPEDTREAIDIGISLERQSIALYTQYLRDFPDNDSTQAIEDVLKEEKNHLEILKAKKAFLS